MFGATDLKHINIFELHIIQTYTKKITPLVEYLLENSIRRVKGFVPGIDIRAERIMGLCHGV